MKLYRDKLRKVTWSTFAHTAQANYVHARIALQSTNAAIGVSLSHQMIELFVKASILYCVLDGDYDAFEQLRKRFNHDTIGLLKKYRNDIPVFEELLTDEELFCFIHTVQVHYVDARFGQVHSMMSPKDECKSLDIIFQRFSHHLYEATSVHTLLFLSIPIGTEPFFSQSEVLDFSLPNCRPFGATIGNIRVLV